MLNFSEIINFRLLISEKSKIIFEFVDLLCQFFMILINSSRGLRQQIYLQYVSRKLLSFPDETRESSCCRFFEVFLLFHAKTLFETF